MALTRVSRHIIDEPFNPTTVSATDVTTTNINASGIGTVGTLRVTGDLTVEGTTTTLDSILTEVDRLEVSANSTVAAGIITQTGSGDILRLFDGASEVFSVADGGAVKIGGAGQLALDVSYDGSSATAAKIVTNTGITNANSTFTFAVNENSGAQLQLKGDGAVIFSKGSTERLRVTSGGGLKFISADSPTSTTEPAQWLNHSGGMQLYGSSGTSTHRNIIFYSASNAASERLRITSDGKVRVPDNGKFVAGAGDDLQIYHNGTHSYIDNVTNGALIIRNTSNDVDVVIESDDGSGGLANYFRADGSSGDAILYHYGSHKLNTLSTGINVVGTINADGLDIDDNAYIKLGTGDDLQIYHDGTNSYIKSINRTIYIDQTADNFDIVMRNDDGSGGLSNYIQLDGSEGSVILSHYGNTRIQTTNTGASVTGNLNISGHTYLNDNRELVIGAGQDLKLYHNANHSIINNSTGDLRIESDRIELLNNASNKFYFTTTVNEEINLYYNNSKKFETTTTGAKVTGALEVTQEYPSIRPTLDLNFAATKVLDDRITFTRDGVGTYVGEDGLVKYASNNTPRFDHDPTTGESLGLLIEESRTNILGLSSDLTDNNGNDWDAVNGTIAVNQTTSPDGTTTAASFTASAGNAEHSVVFAELVPTGDVTASVWVKSNTYSIVSFVLYGEANSTVSYNISTETVYNQGSNVSRATITEYPNGWYRISATMNCTVSNSRAYRLYASTGNFNAGGSESFYYWGPQVESGDFETSYIPTYVSNTSVTRAADIAKITGTNFSDFYNQTEGTVFSSHQQYSGQGDTQNTYVYQIANADSSSVAFRLLDKNNYYSNPARLTATQWTNDVALQKPDVTNGERIRTAFACKVNDAAVSFDGATVLTDTSLDMNSGQIEMSIGGFTQSPQAFLNGHIQQISYYPKRLPNAQLQGLTQQ